MLVISVYSSCNYRRKICRLYLSCDLDFHIIKLLNIQDDVVLTKEEPA